jgi:hypothetical protein
VEAAVDVPELLAAPVRAALGEIQRTPPRSTPVWPTPPPSARSTTIPMAASANCVIVLGKRAG